VTLRERLWSYTKFALVVLSPFLLITMFFLADLPASGPMPGDLAPVGSSAR